jgi:hypothetical protein
VLSHIRPPHLRDAQRSAQGHADAGLTPHGPALAYLRTSSAANVGADKDSEKRLRQAIEAFARHGGYEIVEEFYDTAQ